MPVRPGEAGKYYRLVVDPIRLAEGEVRDQIMVAVVVGSAHVLVAAYRPWRKHIARLVDIRKFLVVAEIAGDAENDVAAVRLKPVDRLQGGDGFVRPVPKPESPDADDRFAAFPGVGAGIGQMQLADKRIVPILRQIVAKGIPSGNIVHDIELLTGRLRSLFNIQGYVVAQFGLVVKALQGGAVDAVLAHPFKVG